MKTTLFLIIILSINSCALMLSAGKDTIQVNTNSKSATVFIDGKQVGSANEPIKLKRKSKNVRTLEVKAEGYQTKTIEVGQKFAPAFLLGILGLGIPMMVDIAAGSAFKPKQKNFDVKLIKL